jgi:hypothetical protein
LWGQGTLSPRPVGGAVHEDNCLGQNALTFRMAFELYFHHSGCKFSAMLASGLLEVAEIPVTFQNTKGSSPTVWTAYYPGFHIPP